MQQTSSRMLVQICFVTIYLATNPRDAIDQLLNATTKIEIATDLDKDSLIAIDGRLAKDPTRLRFALESIARSDLFLARVSEKPAGYVIFNTGFWGEYTFIWSLFTSPEFRKKGVATSLIHHIESICETPKLFISTNQSNLRMQHLLDKLGFLKTGVVENFDEGDPEIFYFKKIH